MKLPCCITSFLIPVAALLAAQPSRAQTEGPAISIDTSAGRHPISPLIYGMAEYGVTPALQSELRMPVLRWGGDGTTRYNWQVDSSNAGFDWYFMGGDGDASPVPSGGPDALVTADKATATQTLLTIPIIPWINRSAAWTCSFPVSVYGAQQSFNPYVHPNGADCGNSLAANGTQLMDTHIGANHIANSPSIQAGWIQHLVSRFGSAAKGGVAYYQLDNEPLGWGNTHRDVMPGGATYARITALGEAYAAAIKQQDPTALVLGPSDFTLGGWVGTPSAQNNLFAGQYYLQQMASYARALGKRVLDYFDEHYYFNFTDPASQLASTRTLWDPTYNGGTWVEQYDFGGPMQLIPRFRQWIAQYYPGTKLSFSEYSIDSGNKLITDALAEADVLGIFGWQAVDLATMWNPPASTDPIAFSFRLYRNYDGKGDGFGTTSVQATSADQGTVAAYAALRGSSTLTLVLINKTTSSLVTPVTLSPATTGTAQVYSYSGADLSAFHTLAPVSFASGAANVTVPAQSMNMLVLPLGSGS